MLCRGMRSQYTQPPNGSLIGTPSRSTSARLTPLGPIPRSDTTLGRGVRDQARGAAEEAEARHLPEEIVERLARRLADVLARQHRHVGGSVAGALLDPRHGDHDGVEARGGLLFRLGGRGESGEEAPEARREGGENPGNEGTLRLGLSGSEATRGPVCSSRWARSAKHATWGWAGLTRPKDGSYRPP